MPAHPLTADKPTFDCFSATCVLARDSEMNKLVEQLLNFILSKNLCKRLIMGGRVQILNCKGPTMDLTPLLVV